MADLPKDKIKYGLLKFIDLSGFKVFDPPIRLIFGEDPQKQIRDIAKFMLLPILFVGMCIWMWHIIGPNHKTKSGAVPGPWTVWNAYGESARFDEREQEKMEDFALEGAERIERISLVKKQLDEFESEAKKLQKISQETEEKGNEEQEKRLAPFKAQMESLTAKIKTAKAERKAAQVALAEKVTLGEAKPEEMIALFAKHSEANTADSEAKALIKAEMDEIRSDPPQEVQKAKLAANKVADEVQHFKKRLDILENSNKEVSKEKILTTIAEKKTELAAATDPKEIAKLSKSIAIAESNLAKADEKKLAPSATIFWQTKRSLATVFVGFMLAALIAIPVGIMCGLNKIVMACLTPIISIFRPVSPVVWLLIFQIIVGAFFLPDPAKHPLFVTLNNEYWFGWIKNPFAFLGTNPAMVFSACTVAMCALWPALVNTALGVSAIDKDHMNVARVLKLGFWQRLFKIVIPSSLPLVFAGLRISLGVGWMVLIAAEALSSSDGLGKFVWDEYQNGSSRSFANIILACFIVGIIGFFLDRIMIVLQKLVSFDDGSATA